MGAFGGTRYASMSLNDVGNVADLDIDSVVGGLDFGLFADEWGIGPDLDNSVGQAPPYISDLDRDGVVSVGDLLIFAREWLGEGG